MNFEPGQTVMPSDDQMGCLIRRVFERRTYDLLKFPITIARVSPTGGVMVLGDDTFRNPECFKHAGGPW